MSEQFALWLTVIMTGVLLIGVTWILTDRIVELRHRVNRLEIYRRLDEDEKFWEKTRKRKWVGLTDEEIEECKIDGGLPHTVNWRLSAKVMQAKLKEKNT